MGLKEANIFVVFLKYYGEGLILIDDKEKKSNHNVGTCSKKPVPYNLKFGKGLNIGSMTLPSVPKSLGGGGGGHRDIYKHLTFCSSTSLSCSM